MTNELLLVKSVRSNTPRGGGRRQPTLDFLRGIAILAVVAFHVAPIFDPGIHVITSLLALGFQGVQLFFLISALTMCYMWDLRLGETRPALKFYIRRVFRIAPPFWIAICGYTLLNGVQSSYWAPDGIGLKQIITNLFFVSGFWPDTINAVVPGGWSIVDEMMFYAFFPFLVSRLKVDAFVYVILAFLVYLANLAIIQPIYDVLFRNSPHLGLVHEFGFFQFFNQAPIFLLGIFLYKGGYAVNSGAGVNPKKNTVFGGAIIAAWLGIGFSLKHFYSLPSSPFFWLSNFVLMAVVVIAFKFELVCKPINRLGQLSYSIYLIHFAVIDGVEWLVARAGGNTHGLLAFVVGLGAALIFCWWLGVLLERTLERTASRYGHRLAEAVSAQPAGVGSGRDTVLPAKATDSGT